MIEVLRKEYSLGTTKWFETKTDWWGLPVLLFFILFVVMPLAWFTIMSFWQFTGITYKPAFIFENFIEIFATAGYLMAYGKTIMFSLITIAVALLLGFPIAFFLTKVVKTFRYQMALFLVILTPFWTSYLIRMIAWVPTFGQQGILNKVLVSLHILKEPSSAFLYSDLATIIALIQLYSLFMAGPIFFSLAGIRRETVEAAQDLGANKFQVFKEIILPLSLPGIAIGSIFIFTITMGEFATVSIIGGGKAATVGTLIKGLLPYNQVPQAAANSVFLIVISAFGLYLMNRIINIRKEL